MLCNIIHIIYSIILVWAFGIIIMGPSSKAAKKKCSWSKNHEA